MRKGGIARQNRPGQPGARKVSAGIGIRDEVDLVGCGGRTEGRARAVARGQRMGRPFKLTDHQKREAIKRRNQGETLADVARSYDVSQATISRFVGT